MSRPLNSQPRWPQVFTTYPLYPMAQKLILRVRSLARNLFTNGIDSDPDNVRSQTVDRPAQAAATFIDGSDPLFSMYDKMAAKRDRKVAENWRSDADNAVVVVRRHFSLPPGYRYAQSL